MQYTEGVKYIYTKISGLGVLHVGRYVLAAVMGAVVRASLGAVVLGSMIKDVQYSIIITDV